MTRSLPPHPNLDQLKHQAKDLVKAHQRGDKFVCETLRLLHRFAKSTDDEILASPLPLQEAQYALALSYGFDSWAKMRHSVEGLHGETFLAMPGQTLLQFSWRGVDASKANLNGMVRALDLYDAIYRVHSLGVLPTAIFRGEAAPADLARCTVETVLLAGLDRCATQQVFDCTGPVPTLQSSRDNGENASGWYDLHTGQALPLHGTVSSAVLGALRIIADESTLGKAILYVRRIVMLGTNVAGTRPRRADLEFHSDERLPGHVRVAPRMPGSDGPRVATKEEIVEFVVKARAKHGSIHVLTGSHDRTEEYGRALSERLGTEQVTVIHRGSQSTVLPATPIIVAQTAEVGFAQIKGHIRGLPAREAVESAIQSTMAICVDIARDVIATPCLISNDEKQLLGSVMIGTLLMLYGQVAEFTEEREA
jgi:hypothetical protein